MPGRGERETNKLIGNVRKQETIAREIIVVSLVFFPCDDFVFTSFHFFFLFELLVRG